MHTLSITRCSINNSRSQETRSPPWGGILAARPLCWAVPGSSTVRRGSRVCLKPGWLRGRCSSGWRHRASLRGSGGAPAAREPPGAGQERKAQNQRGPERCSACPAQSCPPGVRERLATASCRAGPLTRHSPVPRLHIHPTALTPRRGWRGQRSKHKKASSTPCAALLQRQWVALLSSGPASPAPVCCDLARTRAAPWLPWSRQSLVKICWHCYPFWCDFCQFHDISFFTEASRVFQMTRAIEHLTIQSYLP